MMRLSLTDFQDKLENLLEIIEEDQVTRDDDRAIAAIHLLRYLHRRPCERNFSPENHTMKLLLCLHYQHAEEPDEAREFKEIFAEEDGSLMVFWADGTNTVLIASEYDEMHIMFDET